MLHAQLQGKTVVLPLCGGNIDTTTLGRVLERGLAADGRLCRFVATVSDRPVERFDSVYTRKRISDQTI